MAKIKQQHYSHFKYIRKPRAILTSDISTRVFGGIRFLILSSRWINFLLSKLKCFWLCLDVLHTISSRDVIGELITKAWCIQAQNALSPNLLGLMYSICNKLFVFDLKVLVLSCFTNSSLKYIGAHPCMHWKIKSRILN